VTKNLHRSTGKNPQTAGRPFDVIESTMNRRNFIASGLAAGGAFLLCPRPVFAADSSGAPFEVGSHAQLFIDRALVERAEGVSFTLHPARKHPLNPLVQADQPWEGWWARVLGGSVLYDEEEKLFKMWYLTVSECFPDFAVLYATSRDGIQWEKPLVGTLKCEGHPRHNAILDHLEVVSVMKDNAEPDPARRYKMIACNNQRIAPGMPPNNPYAYVSSDGLAWTRISEKPLFHSSDVLTAFYDRQRRLYVAFPKVHAEVGGQRRRCFGVTTSADMLSWTEARMVFLPDQLDDAGSIARLDAARDILLSKDNPELVRTEFYGIASYQAESCVVAFPWVFTINNHLGTGKHDGVAEIQLAVSRDLEKWERPFRTPIVERGAPGEWDCGFLTSAAQAFRFGDEIRLYYSGQNYSHGDPAAKLDPGSDRNDIRAIGLATWPLDRFVSADGGVPGARLTTVPLRFTGVRLELNIDAGSGGWARVELLDAAGRPIDGYGPSDRLTANSLRSNVTWKGNADVSRLAGKPVRLRFELNNAKLYSFAFRRNSEGTPSSKATRDGGLVP
jgi:hypothetical protein